MNNLSPYCGLVDAKIRASDKDLPALYFPIIIIERILVENIPVGNNRNNFLDFDQIILGLVAIGLPPPFNV